MCFNHPDTTRTAARSPGQTELPAVERSDHEIVDSLPLMAERLLSGAAPILCDTETIGLGGIPFLLQFECPQTHIPLIVRVRDHSPKDVLDFIFKLAAAEHPIVGHNLVYDLGKLTHLATVASILAASGQAWSEESVWAAERLWRPLESTFEQRVAALHLFNPKSCVDTLIAARRLPPFSNELQNDPGITFRQIPVAILPRLEAKLAENLNQTVGGLDARWRLGDFLKSKWDDTPVAAVKRTREQAIQNRDYRVLGDVRISIRVPGAYSLKRIAPLLGYAGPVATQDFESVYGRSDETYPVWTVRGGSGSKECGHQDAWNESLRLEKDAALLRYAAADIRMLRVAYDYYTAQPGFSALQHDMALVPWAAAIRMIGVHVDEDAREKAKAAYQRMKDDGQNHCRALGLTNINGDDVLDYVNKHVVKAANVVVPEKNDALDDVDDYRREDTLEPLAVTLVRRRDELERQNKPTDHIGKAIANLNALIQARVFDRKLQFITAISGDTVYPKFDIVGTQTDRTSCSNPNSQQMPSPDRETTWEKHNEVHFRAMFTAPEGFTMAGGDFDQLELRIKSGVTQDPFTQSIYAKETAADPADEHSEMALKIFNAELHQSVPDKSDTELLALLKAKDKAVKSYRTKAM